MLLVILACCNRYSVGCATHALVENILSIIAASVLLYLDNLFLNNPYKCLYGSILDCSSFSYDSVGSIFSETGYKVKMACIKAQLACAAVMLVTNVVYIVIFVVVAIKTRNTPNQVGLFHYGTVPYPAVPPATIKTFVWIIEK